MFKRWKVYFRVQFSFKAHFHLHFIMTTVIQAYIPTNEADEEDKKDFCEKLQKIVDGVSKNGMLQMIGEWNWMHKWEHNKLSKMESWDDMLSKEIKLTMESCSFHFVLLTTLQLHRFYSCTEINIHKYTWTSPCSKYHNQIDHIVDNKFNIQEFCTRCASI